MLVLTRKAGESICIGGNVQITVLDVRGERVRVGLSAPPEVQIRRQELVDRDSRPEATRPVRRHGTVAQRNARPRGLDRVHVA